LKSRLLALDAFGVSLTSYAKSSDESWPLVDFPDFAARGWTLRQQMKSEALGLMPVVNGIDRADWEAYAIEKQGWVKEAREWERNKRDMPRAPSRSLSMRGSGQSEQDKRQLTREADFSKGVSKSIYTVNSGGIPVVDEGSGPFTPVWKTSPAPPSLSNINFNLLSHQLYWKGIESSIESKEAVISQVFNLDSPHQSISGIPSNRFPTEPISAIYYPVFEDLIPGSDLVAVLAAEMTWSQFFEGALPSTATGLTIVIENSCRQSFTYQIQGGKVTFLGSGDLHERKFNDMVKAAGLNYLTTFSEDFAGARLNFEHCPFALKIYPSAIFFEGHETNQPVIYATAIVVLFAVASAVFIFYDHFHKTPPSKKNASVVVMERRLPRITVKPSLKTRIMGHLQNRRRPIDKPGATLPHFEATIRALPMGDACEERRIDPLSDATVMFADVLGMDKWGAGRDPEAKNSLLETIHRSFNAVAKRHGIFQVEMTANCFVAVAGMQETDDDHATRMAHFVCDSRKRVTETLKSVSKKGLSIRYGLHSGHVQAGLDGNESSRFQLFGDTVDTAYQMLTNGKANKVHVSVDTAELLNLAGWPDWIVPRKDLVLVKGKGEMSTFWMKPKICLSACQSKALLQMSEEGSTSDSTIDDSEIWTTASETSDRSAVDENRGIPSKNLVERNVQILRYYLKKIQARRIASRKFSSSRPRDENTDIGMGDPIIEEARETVRMPPFEANVVSNSMNADFVELPEGVEGQLRLYITSIASTYRKNEFHNIDHATHATIAMDKMLKQINESDEPETYVDFGGQPRAATALASDLDKRTFGIASDPLTQFTMVFASLVHDVDHVGVSNHQLIKEKSPIASLYKNKSVAEQNSVDIAWWLLMTPNFSELRSAIYLDSTEMRRFRQLLVNTVVATDILDRDLKMRRDKGWHKAFRNGVDIISDPQRDLQATVVVEHLLQAADAVHTMQTFRTYLKWSEKLFHEMYHAHNSGRAEKDPAKSWYSGELAFFDKFVIPLARRLRDCGVFGEDGDEYLRNATENRNLWGAQGKKIVRVMVEEYCRNVVAQQGDTIMFS